MQLAGATHCLGPRKGVRLRVSEPCRNRRRIEVEGAPRCEEEALRRRDKGRPDEVKLTAWTPRGKKTGSPKFRRLKAARKDKELAIAINLVIEGLGSSYEGMCSQW